MPYDPWSAKEHPSCLRSQVLIKSETEFKVHYQQLVARTYHPAKNDLTETELTTAKASDFFKLLNNTNKYSILLQIWLNPVAMALSIRT